MTVALAAVLAAINVWTVAAFAHDKRRAVVGGRRVPERWLLALAAIGGTPGAFAARAMLRHKTRKQPFGMWLWGIAVAQAAVVLLMVATRF